MNSWQNVGVIFLVKTWILNYTWMTQKESADLVEQQQSYSIQQDPTFPISCTFQLNLHRNGWHLVIKVCKCFIDVLKPKFHPILMSGLGDIPDFAYKWRIRVGPRKVNLIGATCSPTPMWVMVIECLWNTFWPDPSKDLRFRKLWLHGGGYWGLVGQIGLGFEIYVKIICSKQILTS